MALTTNPFAWLRADEIKAIDITRPVAPLVLQPKAVPKKLTLLKPSDIKKVDRTMDAIPTTKVETQKSDYDAQVAKHKETAQRVYKELWWFNDEETNFLKEAKKRGADMNRAILFVQQQRAKQAPKTIWQKVEQWLTDIWGWIYKSAQALPQLWEKAGDYIAKQILWEDLQKQIKAKMWPDMVQQTADLLDRAWVNQESIAFKGAKWVGDFAQTAAVTTTIPWAWLLRWTGTLWKIAVWAWEGALWTQVSSLIEKGEIASAKETAIGAGVWWVLRGVSGILQKWGSQKATEKLIMPELTKAERATRWAKQLSKTNIFGKVSYLPSKQEQESAKKFATLLRPNKTVSSNINRVVSKINEEWDNLIKQVATKNVAFNPKEITARMRKIEKPLMIRGGENESKYDAVIRKFEEILKTKPKNAVWLLEARKDLDKWIDSEIPNLYNSDAMTPLRVAITKIRKVPNEWLNEQIGDDIVKNSLQTQSQLFDIRDNLATKIETEWSTALSRWIKRNPAKAKAIGWGALVWWWYALWNKWSLPSNPINE